MNTARLLSLFLLLLGLSLSCIHVDAMIGQEQIDISPSEIFTIVWAFEYAEGGQLEMDITLLNTPSIYNTNASIQFLLCSDAQIDPLRNVHLDEVCNKVQHNAFKPCDQYASLGAAPWAGPTSVHLNLTTKTTDWYRLLQLNCKPDAWSFSISYAAMNPHGEYLSLSQVPYKTLYIVTSCLWMALAAVWIYNWYRYRFFNIKLQRVLSLVPATKIALSFTELYYWRQASITGHFPQQIYWLWLAIVSIDWVIYHSALLLCAKGWSITRKQLTNNERNRMIALVGVLLISYGVYKYFAGFLLFFLVVMYVILLRYIFMAVVENTGALIEQFRYVEGPPMNIDPMTTPVATKLQMFRRFQIAMVVYISVDIIFHLWTTIFARSMPWIEDMMEHVITSLLAIVVGYIFAMRPFNPYFYRIVNHMNEHDSNRIPHDADDNNPLSEHLLSNAASQDTSSYMCEWRPGMPIPPIPHDTEAWLKETTEEEAPIILVENPFNADFHGNAQETVVVATPAYEGRGIILATVSRRSATSRAGAGAASPVEDAAGGAGAPVANAEPATSMLVRMRRSLSGAFSMVRQRSSSGAGSSSHNQHQYRQLEDGSASEMVERERDSRQNDEQEEKQ